MAISMTRFGLAARSARWMIWEEKNLAILRIHSDLLKRICTQGWSVGRESIVECTKGLPEGAEYVHSYQGTDGYICLVFRHESFGHLRNGRDLPILEIEHSCQMPQEAPTDDKPSNS